MSWNKKSRQDLAGQSEQVLKAALRYMGRREYTAAELARRLSERGADSGDIRAALQYLQERGYQDDARAAESHIRQRREYAPRGRALLRQELRERGVAGELAESLLAEHYPPEQELALLRRLLAQERPPSAATYEERRRLWQKMARRLAAKGFSQSMLTQELAAWMPAGPEYDE